MKNQDIETNKLYAAKIITSEYNEESLNREIGILMYANHPTIINFFGFSLQDLNNEENITILMELAENGSLLDILNQIRSDKIIENYNNTSRQIILIGISRGMKYLHNLSIIHRDLKPGNVLLDKNFEPHITDFGMSKFFHIDDSKNQSSPVGTSMYMAPEINEDAKYGRKADVYAFGILMYEVVTEFFPYPDLKSGKINEFNFIKKVVNENYRHVFVKPIKESLKELIEKCWSKDENERPTFSEIFEKLSNKNNEFGYPYFLNDVNFDKINNYVESITKIDDPIEKLNHQLELIEKQNKRLVRDNERLTSGKLYKTSKIYFNEYNTRYLHFIIHTKIEKV